MPHDIPAGRYVTVEEAVGIMGCTGGYVRRLLRAGKLPGHQLNPRMWLVPLAAAEAAKADLTSRSTGKRAAKAKKVAKKRRKR